MKTTIDIPEQLLKEVMQATGSKTIKGAVLTALNWYNHRGRQREVIARLGTLKGFMAQTELRQNREEREERHDDRRQQLVDRGAPRSRQPGGTRARRKTA